MLFFGNVRVSMLESDPKQKPFSCENLLVPYHTAVVNIANVILGPCHIVKGYAVPMFLSQLMFDALPPQKSRVLEISCPFGSFQ